MSLKDRLSRLTGEAARTLAGDHQRTNISELRRKIDEIMTRRERMVQPKLTPRAQDTRSPLESVVDRRGDGDAHGQIFLFPQQH